MLVLFDHSTPAPLSAYLRGHQVTEARTRGWDTLPNGDLLAAAEKAGFDVFLTADENIRYQQNHSSRRIALVVLSTPQCREFDCTRENCGGGKCGYSWQLHRG